MRTRPIQLSGDPDRDVAALQARIEERDHAETVELCAMLAAIETPAAEECLRRLAVHEDQNLRAAAVRHLVPFLAEEASRSSLRHALGDARPIVVQAALRLVREEQLDGFCKELRALAAMPNEDASEAWLAVANEALRVLADCCTEEDLDLSVRAFADSKLERGGGDLLQALFTRLPVELLCARLQDRELCAQVLPRLMTDRGAPRLRELAEQGSGILASQASLCLKLHHEQRDLRPIPADARRSVADIQPQRNDGDRPLAYSFCDDAALNARLGRLLNEACHVFHSHAQGTWKDLDKDRYATALCAEIQVNPWLIKRLMALQDRVVAMLTYRAMQLRDQASTEA